MRALPDIGSIGSEMLQVEFEFSAPSYVINFQKQHATVRNKKQDLIQTQPIYLGVTYFYLITRANTGPYSLGALEVIDDRLT